MEPSSTFSTWQLGESYITKLLEMSFLQLSKVNYTIPRQLTVVFFYSI
jgi:hypothetical protein